MMTWSVKLQLDLTLADDSSMRCQKIEGRASEGCPTTTNIGYSPTGETLPTKLYTKICRPADALVGWSFFSSGSAYTNRIVSIAGERHSYFCLDFQMPITFPSRSAKRPNQPISLTAVFSLTSFPPSFSALERVSSILSTRT